MNIDYPKIIEYFETIDGAPVISLLISCIEQLQHDLKAETLPQFDERVLRGYDPAKDDKYSLGGIYPWGAVTHTRSHLLDFFEKERTLGAPARNLEIELQRCVADIEHDRKDKGEIGPEFSDYRLRRTTIHFLRDAEQEIPEFVRQAQRDVFTALFDCSSHLQTNEKSLYLAKMLLEARIEEQKNGDVKV